MQIFNNKDVTAMKKQAIAVRRQTIWDRLAHYLRDTFLPVLFPV
jgi:hypothetical protein